MTSSDATPTPSTTLDALTLDQCELLHDYSVSLGFLPDVPWHASPAITTGTCLLCQRPLSVNLSTGEASCLGVPRLHTWADLGDLLDRLPIVIPTPCAVSGHTSELCMATRLREGWVARVAEIIETYRLTLTTAERRERQAARDEYTEQLVDRAMEMFIEGLPEPEADAWKTSPDYARVSETEVAPIHVSDPENTPLRMEGGRLVRNESYVPEDMPEPTVACTCSDLQWEPGAPVHHHDPECAVAEEVRMHTPNETLSEMIKNDFPKPIPVRDVQLLPIEEEATVAVAGYTDVPAEWVDEAEEVLTGSDVGILPTYPEDERPWQEIVTGVPQFEDERDEEDTDRG